MKTSKFFFSTLIAASAMTATAYAEDYTVTDNSQDLINATTDDTVTIDFSSNSNSYLYSDSNSSSYVINASVKIADATIHNGFSDKTYIFNGDVTGTGLFYYQADRGSNNQTYIFNGDVSGYSGDMIIDANKYGSFTFNNNETGTGAITATSAWCAVNFNGATINNSEVNAATINISGTTSFVANTSLIGKVVVASGAEASNTGTLNLSDAKVSLNGVALVNTGTVSVGSKTIFDLTSVDGAQTLISGGTITGWNTLRVSNFTLNGNVLAGRSTVELSNAGQVSITQVVATLVWNGGEQGTWDVESSENWLNNGQADKFYALDNVEFTDSTANGTIDVASAATVTDFTVRSGTHTLTRSNDGYVAIAGSATIENGATLILGTETGSTGLLRGAITVKNGGTLQFNAKDVTGYNGGANSLQTITVEEGGSLIMNVKENETFAGTLNLNGTLKSGTNAGPSTCWDLYGGNAKIVVSSGAKAKIESGVALRLRQGDKDKNLNSIIDIGADGNLEIASSVIKGDRGNYVLEKNGEGKLTLSGTGTDINGIKVNSGDLNITGKTATFNGTDERQGLYAQVGDITIGDGTNNTLVTATRLEMGDLNSPGESDLVVNKNATLKITGGALEKAQDTWSSSGNYKTNTVVLGGWSASTTATINGTLLVKDASIGFGDKGGSVSVSGLIAAKGIGMAGVANGSASITLDDGGKLILGENGISSKKTDFTVSMNAGTVGIYSDSMTIAKGVSLNNSETGTTFDTQKYVFADDGNSVNRSEDGGEIIVSGVISGSGKLIKTGEGTLTLFGENDTSANCYTGGTEIQGGTLKVQATGWSNGENGNTWNRGDIGGHITQDYLKISGGGILEVVKAQDSKNEATYGTAGALRGFIVSGEGTYKYSGTEDSKITTVADQNAHIGLEAESTLIFDVVNDATTLDVSKVIAATGANGGNATTGSLQKTGAGTLLLSGDNKYTGGTTISAGTLVAGSNSALGTNFVKISGGKLEVSSGVTVSNNITVVLGDTLDAAVITGDGSLGEKITLDYAASAENVALALATEETTKTYTLLSGTVGSSLSMDSFELGTGWADGWKISGYVYDSETRVGTLTLGIPEPSAFGLLAGVGALALVASRRRRSRR